MKAYGLKKADLPRDCTSTGKYGTSVLGDKCACGARHGRRSKDHKGRKANVRRVIVGEGEE